MRPTDLLVARDLGRPRLSPPVCAVIQVPGLLAVVVGCWLWGSLCPSRLFAQADFPGGSRSSIASSSGNLHGQEATPHAPPVGSPFPTAPGTGMRSRPAAGWTMRGSEDPQSEHSSPQAVGNASAGDPYSHPSPTVVTASASQPVSAAAYPSVAPQETSDISTPAAPAGSAAAVNESASAKRTPFSPSPRALGQVDSDSPGKSGSLISTMMSVGSSLLIVIGLFLGVAWCYRKTSNTALGGGLPKHVVKILGKTPIAPRQHLLLVRFGSKLVLVSMAQGEARTLSEITDPLEVDEIAGMCESSQPGSITNSFRSILSQGESV